MKQAKLLGYWLCDQRLTKKVCTGSMFLLEEPERAREQAIEYPGAVVYPLSEEQSRKLFQISMAVQTDLRERTLEKFDRREQAINRVGKKK